jgi:hypothetical protein
MSAASHDTVEAQFAHDPVDVAEGDLVAAAA